MDIFSRFEMMAKELAPPAGSWAVEVRNPEILRWLKKGKKGRMDNDEIENRFVRLENVYIELMRRVAEAERGTEFYNSNGDCIKVDDAIEVILEHLGLEVLASKPLKIRKKE